MTKTADPQVIPLRNPGFSSAVVENKPPHWPLPEPGDALPLVPSDLENAAAQLGVEVAVIRAVALTESSGAGFDNKNRPKLRYENHYFKRLTNGFYDKYYPELSCAHKSKMYRATHPKHPLSVYTEKQWEMLNKCWAIDEADAGVMSCSWGMFQTMGENYKKLGWTSLEQFVKDMFYSEAQHLRAFLGYCKAYNLVRYLQQSPPDFTNFAIGYNGPDQSGYDTTMQKYYNQFTTKKK